jgi:stage II sporulation protein D
VSWRNTPRQAAALIAAALVIAEGAVASCRSAAPKATAPEAPAAKAPAAEAYVQPPLIRVGLLTDARRASIGADSGVRVSYASATGQPAVRPLGRATFLAVAGADGQPKLRLVETGEDLVSALVIPEKLGESIYSDASAYRGVVEVRADGPTSLIVVNVVHFEDYLRGVVPNELSPQVYPEIEALKAQAVAARTYALRNLGQFKSKGYDLCATPACQVYRGRSSEHPLTDQAIAETAGVVISYRGALINALYTSTCGGHTEDGQNIFEGEPTPYLRGVSCAPERGTWGHLKTTASREPLGPEEGLNRDVALLVSLGVFEPAASTKKSLKGLATDKDVTGWTQRLLAAAHRTGCSSRAEPPLARRASFFRHLVSSLCWEERGRRLVAPLDGEYLLQVEDRGELRDQAERDSAVLLLREGILAPFADNTLRPNSVVTRAQAAALLARLLLRAGAPGLGSAEVRAVDGGTLRVRGGDGDEASYEVAPDVWLFRAFEQTRTAASELTVVPGDPVRFVASDGRIRYLEAEQPRSGPSSDRSSRYYSWEVRLSGEEIAKSLARFGSVGRVRDVAPRRIGVSGRVVELAVLGSDGELVLKGLRIRWGLGLRENLFVVDREREGDSVTRFIFTGKGWGHGVGLCQVGAYGLAQTGVGYDQILRHYYTGVSVAAAP